MVQQEEGEQSRDFWVVGHRDQLPSEPDRLGGEVDVAAVTFVEYQIQHLEHGAKIAGLIESNAAQRSLGSADPLGHRRFGHEIGRSDLTGREPADGTKCQGDS